MVAKTPDDDMSKLGAAIGEGTGVRLSLVITTGGAIIAALLWLGSALSTIREQIKDVAAGTRSNAQQISSLKELVTVQIQAANRDTLEIQDDIKDLEIRVRALENGRGK